MKKKKYKRLIKAFNLQKETLQTLIIGIEEIPEGDVTKQTILLFLRFTIVEVEKQIKATLTLKKIKDQFDEKEVEK